MEKEQKGRPDPREASVSDRDRILALRREVFPTDDVEKAQPDFWEWEFVRGYAGAGRFFIAEAGGRVVAHLGFVPQDYGALAVDAMTHPDFRGQGVFSRLTVFAANAARAQYPVIAAFQIRPAVMKGMIAGGWTPSVEVPVLLKPLLFRKSDPAVRPIDDLREIRWRSTAFLEWRFRQNPYWRYEIAGYYDRGQLMAYAIHRDTVLRGVKTLAIADAGGDTNALKRLLRHVCGNAKGVRLAAALLSRDHPAYAAARSAGFFPGPHRFRLLLQGTDRPWPISWGDTDHL